MLERAKQEHRAGITAVQRCWGKTFEGQAFLSEPKIIEYPDFDANVGYAQTVELTNVSLTFNQFKLLPMDDRIRDFFEIKFDPPGRMSAGVSTKFQLKFLPKLYQDIWTTFPILAHTGAIDFPVRCLTKKTILDIEPKEETEEEKLLKEAMAASAGPGADSDDEDIKQISKKKIVKKGPPDPTVPPELRDEEYWKDPSENLFIDLGSVVFGESCQRQLTIKNTGALGAGYFLREATPADEPEPEKIFKNEFRFTKTGKLDALGLEESDLGVARAEERGALLSTSGVDIGGEAEGAVSGTESALSGAEGAAADLATGTASGSGAAAGGGAGNKFTLPQMLQVAREGHFVAHGTSKIVFQFTPRHLGEFACKFVLEVDNQAPGDARFRKFYYLKMVGKCVDVPIYVEREILNLHTILYNHTFREMIPLRNRSAVAMKIKVEKPNCKDPRLKEGEITVNPTTAFLQGNGGGQKIQFRLNLKPDFLQRNPQYRRDERKYGPAAFKIPIKVVGAEQELPVFCCVVGNLTDNSVSFNPKSLDFGPCFVNSTCYKKIQITNHSKLPQSFCVARLPPYLSLSHVAQDTISDDLAGGVHHMDDGEVVRRVALEKSSALETGGNAFVGSLLPEETTALCVKYAPIAATEVFSKLNFCVLTGTGLCSKQFTLPVTGQGRPPLLAIDRMTIQMPAIPVSSVVTQSFEVRNLSEKQVFELSVGCPPKKLAGLFICPVCTELAPSELTRVQIQFRPTREYERLLIDCEDDMGNGIGSEGGVLQTNAAFVAKQEARAAKKAAKKGGAAAQGEGAADGGEEETGDGAGDDGGEEEETPGEKAVPRTRAELIAAINKAGGRRWEHARENEEGLMLENRRDLKKKVPVALPLVESQHALWKIPILIRPVVIKNEKKVVVPDEQCQQLWVSVRTVTVAPPLVPTPDMWDFGEITVWERNIAHITLRSRVDDPQEIHLTSRNLIFFP